MLGVLIAANLLQYYAIFFKENLSTRGISSKIVMIDPTHPLSEPPLYPLSLFSKQNVSMLASISFSFGVKVMPMYFPKRDELLLRIVRAFPNDSRMGVD